MVKPESLALLRLTVVFALILVGLSIVLIAFRVEQVLLEFAQSRGLRAAHQVREQIEGGFRLGLSLPDQTNLGEWLQRQRNQESSLAGARVQTDSSQSVASVGSQAAFNRLNPIWTAQLLAPKPATGARPLAALTRRAGSMAYIGVPIADAAGRRIAVVWLAFDRTALEQSAWSILRALWLDAIAVVVALAFMLAGLAWLWLRWTRQRMAIAGQVLLGNAGGGQTTAELTSPTWHKPLLPVSAGVLVLAALLALAWQAREVARPLLLTQIDQNARTVLSSAEGHIERALALGVPADQLVGVEAMFESELQPAEEIAFMALKSPDGSIAAFSPGSGINAARSSQAKQWLAEPGGAKSESLGSGYRTASQPVASSAGLEVGELTIGTPLNYVDERVRSMLLDLLLAMVVSWVLMRELLGALWQRSVLKPYFAVLATANSGFSSTLVRIRLTVFFTALSEELLRPVFAIFASETSPPLAGVALSPAMLAGLPVAAFMLTLALAQPLGPWVARHIQTRRALCLGALLGAFLMAATAFVQSGLLLIALRAGSGVVYGLMLILSQTAIVHLSTSGQRARSLVEVSAAIVAAGVCGPALGGLLAERLGAPATFLACAACLLAAAIVSLGLPALPSASASTVPAGLGGWRGMAAVLSNHRVRAVICCAAIPARLAAAALLVVIAPLYLLELGETGAVTGRVLLLYFLAFMLTAPWIARHSDLSGQRKPWIVAGCSLSAVACAALLLVGGVAGAALCCALLGIGQALLSAPMVALVTESFDNAKATDVTPAQALAAFRFIERFGSVLAPFAVAFGVAIFGLAGAAFAIGALLALGAVAVTFAFSRYANERKPHHAVS